MNLWPETAPLDKLALSETFPFVYVSKWIELPLLLKWLCLKPFHSYIYGNESWPRTAPLVKLALSETFPLVYLWKWTSEQKPPDLRQKCEHKGKKIVIINCFYYSKIKSAYLILDLLMSVSKGNNTHHHDNHNNSHYDHISHIIICKIFMRRNFVSFFFFLSVFAPCCLLR